GVVPGAARQPRRLRAPAREGVPPPYTLRSRAPRRRRRVGPSSSPRRGGYCRSGFARALRPRALGTQPHHVQHAVEAQLQPPDSVEKEEHPKTDEHCSTCCRYQPIAVAEPPERAHRLRERDSDEQKSE